ncbi:hypothetical protein [Paraburkholderia sp. SIMBA_054]|uniref:hypothetical protein n=1 Tax=Paraburkholderia sp. SIMBA_054 TaxID=3085795 RepID=UPI00397A42BA
MAMNTAKFLRKYSVIPVIAIASGVIATVLTNVEAASSASAAVTESWPQPQLEAAASAALAFRRDEGRLPATLDELRAAKTPYLPNGFELKGVMYFRDEYDRPRLSWRDDDSGVAAYCPLDAAVHHHCI